MPGIRFDTLGHAGQPARITYYPIAGGLPYGLLFHSSLGVLPYRAD